MLNCTLSTNIFNLVMTFNQTFIVYGHSGRRENYKGVSFPNLIFHILELSIMLYKIYSGTIATALEEIINNEVGIKS